MAESRLNVLVGAKIQGLTQGLKKAKRSLRKFERNTAAMGSTLTTSLTVPMLGFAAASIKAFDQQAKAEASLRTALGENKVAFKNLTEQAREFQKVSLFGDEVIIQQQSYLASLGMTEEQINKVIAASIDLAAGTGQTLEFGVRNLAKTFAGLTGELGESIPALKDLTKEQLKAGAAVDVVAKQFKGQGEAAAEAGLGGFTQLKNSMMDFAEEVGKALMPMLKPLRKRLQEATDKLSELSTAQITAKIKTALFVGAIGPLLIGLSKLAAAIRVLTAHPIMLILTGIAALAYKLKNEFTPAVTNAFREERKLYLLRKKYGEDLKSGKRTATGQLDVGFLVSSGREEVEREIARTEEAIASLTKQLEDAGYLGTPIAEVPLYDSKSQTNWKALRKTLFDSTEDLGNLQRALSEITKKEDEAKKKQDQYNKTLSTGAENTTAFTEAQFQLSLQLAAVSEQFKTLSDQIISFKERWLDLGQSIITSIGDAFMDASMAQADFFETLKQNLKQALNLLLAMALRAAVIAAIMTVITGGSFGGGASAGGTNFMTQFQNILTGGNFAGRAVGGFASAGTPYLVGEHGPELFTPSGSSGGHISSASQTANIMTIPDVRISGEDLLIVFDRANRHRNSLG